MSRTERTHRRYDRKGDNYVSDRTDVEWMLTAPLMPPTKTTGRPRTTCLCDVFDATLYIETTGCQYCPAVVCAAMSREGLTNVNCRVKRGHVAAFSASASMRRTPYRTSSVNGSTTVSDRRNGRTIVSFCMGVLPLVKFWLALTPTTIRCLSNHTFNKIRA